MDLECQFVPSTNLCMAAVIESLWVLLSGTSASRTNSGGRAMALPENVVHPRFYHCKDPSAKLYQNIYIKVEFLVHHVFPHFAKLLTSRLVETC